jgi:predicted amidohydrolase
MQPVLLDKNANLQKLSALMEHAAKKHIEFTVFPECCLSGYDLTPEEAHQAAISLPGPETNIIEEQCRKLNMFVVIGFIEAGEDGKHYNSAALIGPQGLAGSYRKTHLPFLGVDRFLEPGQELPVLVNTPLGRIGLLICYDVFFPEAARINGLAGAQVIAIPTAWSNSDPQFPEFVRARAAENDLYVIGTNWVGTERGETYLGNSIIANSDGQTLAQGSNASEEILSAEIDLEKTHRGRRIFIPGRFEMDLWRERRSDLYHSITDAYKIKNKTVIECPE